MRALAGELRAQALLLAGFVGLIWLAEIADQLLFDGALDAAGIQPRNRAWLWGIALAPFLHANWAHLAANTVPLVVLGWLVLVRRRLDFLLVTAVVALLGGLGVWLFGRPNTIHIGASGVVFGYLGYLFIRAWVERSLTAMALAVVAALLYGGALWGVLPTRGSVSWEGHLFGFAGGGAAARLVAPRRGRASARAVAPPRRLAL
jgi:membrane associated rhomboid family serine protease